MWDFSVKETTMAEQELAHSRLTEVLAYEPSTGVFTWIEPPKTKPYLLGKQAGTIDAYGYRYIRVDGIVIAAGRLAWFYVTGEWPLGQVDHRNRNRDDNRWKNLRDLTASQNQHNRGFSGVSWLSSKRRWRVVLRLESQSYYGGRHQCFGAALAARNALKRKLHPSSPC